MCAGAGACAVAFWMLLQCGLAKTASHSRVTAQWHHGMKLLQASQLPDSHCGLGTHDGHTTTRVKTQTRAATKPPAAGLLVEVAYKNLQGLKLDSGKGVKQTEEPTFQDLLRYQLARGDVNTGWRPSLRQWNRKQQPSAQSRTPPPLPPPPPPPPPPPSPPPAPPPRLDLRSSTSEPAAPPSTGLCGPGTEGPAANCVVCAAGKYKSDAGVSSCAACPANSWSQMGSASAVACFCNAWYTVPLGGECSTCAAGKVWSKIHFRANICPCVLLGRLILVASTTLYCLKRPQSAMPPFCKF
jgi:hypothetical protein